MVFEQLREHLDSESDFLLPKSRQGMLTPQTDNLYLGLVAVLSVVGLATLLSYPLSLIRVLLTFTPLSWPFRYNLSRLLRPGPNGSEGPYWAVVTGATGDIGKEFSFQLARKGFSIFLVGRNKAALASLADDVLAEAKKSKHGQNVQTDWHPIDLQTATESDWIKYEHAVASLPGQIVILCNNAGISHHVPVPFEDTPAEELASIPAVNVVAVLRLTRIVLPRMLKNGKSKGGVIFNIGSFSALVPTPYLATYAATKGFLYTWSQALGEELKEKGITVRLLNPYFVVRHAATPYSVLSSDNWSLCR